MDSLLVQQEMGAADELPPDLRGFAIAQVHASLEL